MKVIFSVIAILEIISLLAFLFAAFAKKIKASKILIALNFSLIIITASYLLMCYTGNIRLATVLSSLHFASMDWILLLLCSCILNLPYYSQKKDAFYKFLNGVAVLVILDSFFLLSNIFSQRVMELIPVLTADGRPYNWVYLFKKPYYIHMGFTYFLSCTFIVLGIIRVAKIPVLFQKKYYVLIGSFCALVIFNGLFVGFRWAFNFSILFYTVEFFIFVHFVLNSIPQEFSGILMEQVALNISTAVICYDMDGKFIFANNIARLLFQGGSQENMNIFMESYLLQWLKKFPDSGKTIAIEDDAFVLNGSSHVFSGELTKLTDKKNRLIGYLIRLDDKTDYLKLLEKEKYLATHDSLTGLLNREAFLSRCEEIIRSDRESKYMMVCADVDNFKLVNDIFGEEIGNDILIGEARTLEKISFEGCIHGRISGDKFAMLIKKQNFNPEQISREFDFFQNQLSRQFHYRIRIFLGIYEIENPDEDIQSMCDRGFMAIEKNAGDFTTTMTYYDMSMVQDLINEKNVLNDFSRALEAGEFLFYIQPQFNAKTKRVLGGEALVRWNQPIKGLLSPNNFVPILEKSDYIASLDYYIWEQVAKKLKDWKDGGYYDFYISVNISAKDFYYLDVYESLTKLVEKYGINPKNMNLEVTETILMSNVVMNQKILAKLQEYGFTIEMDDFGSGYSSLSTLRSLVMDVLKIDMEFLRSTENYEQSLKIINRIIDMAKALNMTVITEGVEMEKQAEELAKMGCDFFQGYYFSRPIPVSAFEKRFIRMEGEEQGQS